MIEGSLESNFRPYGQMEKQRWEESEVRKSQQKGRSEKRKSQEKEDAGAQRGRKVAKHLWLRRVAKAAGAKLFGEMRDEKLHAVVAQRAFRSQNLTSGVLLDVDMSKKWTPLHAVVARSTCRSQNTQSTILGALLEVEMFKKCTPLWRDVPVVKMHKAHQCQNTFGS